MGERQLTREGLETILHANRMEDVSFSQWIEWFREEIGAHLRPERLCATDPRTADRVIFNPSRAKRPHEPAADSSKSPCIVCDAQLTKVIDVADLSEGFTCINKNLYPVVFPHFAPMTQSPEQEFWPPPGAPVFGLHLLQWTSSLHELDWHNMPRADRGLAMRRLAALEKKLLRETREFFPPASTWGGPPGVTGFVQVIKNSGAPVGGSVRHGHQQIALVNVMPRRTRDDWTFQQKHGETFADYMLRENPSEFTLHENDRARWLVPYYMRRPFDSLFILRDTKTPYLHELTDDDLLALGDGWCWGIRSMRRALEELGRPVAYNVVLHTGPGAGIYLEFLPYTQETGGMEHAGLWVCQARPGTTAATIRDYAVDKT